MPAGPAAWSHPQLGMSARPQVPFLSLNLLCCGVPIHMYEIKFGHFLLQIRIVSS